MKKIMECWCGNKELIPFSDGYSKCSACETLVAETQHEQNLSNVSGDANHFYGRDYWFRLQEKKLGYPSIQERARRDLPERCLHWLSTILNYKLPPADILELGSAHGGFVALLRWTGFDSIGLEINQWLVDYARSTFGIPVLLGPVEDQNLERESFDVVVMMDVLEHFTDPLKTINYCLSLMKKDGIFIIQTPRFPENMSYEELVAKSDRFLDQLSREKGHLYLFSQISIRKFFYQLGCQHVQFQPAIFGHYDMFLIVSRVPLTTNHPGEIEKALSATPGGYFVQALLDLGEDKQAELTDLRQQFESVEADLRQQFESVEADRAAQLEVIEQQGRRLGELETERDKLRSERDRVLGVLFSISKTRTYKFLRRLGRWKAIEQMISKILEGSIPPAG